MARGDPGHAGQAAPRAVEEEPNNGPGSVTLLPLLMGVKKAGGDLQTPHHVTWKIVHGRVIVILMQS